MVLKYCTLAQVFLVFELDKDSAKMQRCGEGCHNVFGENAGNLLSPELCLCVWRGTKEAGYKKKVISLSLWLSKGAISPFHENSNLSSSLFYS